MSGDHGSTYYNEVNTIKQFAIDDGVSSSDIFMDHAGFSTYESMYRAKEIFEAREILARFKDFFKTVFKPEPTYLGEVIPVSGNGNITNDK